MKNNFFLKNLILIISGLFFLLSGCSRDQKPQIAASPEQKQIAIEAKLESKDIPPIKAKESIEPAQKIPKKPLRINSSELPLECQFAIVGLKNNDISNIIKTPFGYYIVKVINKNISIESSFDLIVANSQEEADTISKKLNAGNDFLSIEGARTNILFKDLPEGCGSEGLLLSKGEVSPPIKTEVGYFIIRLAKAKCDGFRYSVRAILVPTEDKGKEILSKIKSGEKFENISSDIVSDEKLPLECRNELSFLEENDISNLIPTSLGFYIMQVVKKTWNPYYNFKEIAEEIPAILRKESVTDSEAGWYYESHKEAFKKEKPVYIARAIALNLQEDADKIYDELSKITSSAIEEKDKAISINMVFIENSEVSEYLIPMECQKEIEGKKIGQILPPIKTPIGYMIVKIEDIDLNPIKDFEEVKDGIKFLLSQNSSDPEIRKKMELSQNQILMWALHNDIMLDIDSVKDEEAVNFWENHKDRFPDIKDKPAGINLEHIKRTILSDKYIAMLKSLREKYRIEIQEDLL